MGVLNAASATADLPDSGRPTNRSTVPRPERWWTAFGETKTTKQWAADPRCNVAYGTLYHRLHTLKMHPEQAIAQSLPSKTFLSAFGEQKTAVQWAQDPRCKVTYSCLLDRLKDGVPIESAMTRAGKMMRRKKSARQHTAWGEAKTLEGWSRDPRCLVHLALLRKRVGYGVPLEMAMSQGGTLKRDPRQFEAFGVRKTLPGWVRDPRCRCSYRTLLARLKSGVTFALALVDPSPSARAGRSMQLEAFGETKSVGDWARDPRCIVSEETLRNRLRKGEPAARAMTEPLDNSTTVAAFGETRRLSEWIRDPRAAVSRGTLMRRLSEGEPFEQALCRANKDNYRKPNTYVIAIFNESKSITEWGLDPRCEISASGFRKRIRAGVPPELALKSGTRTLRHRTYSAFGEDKILSEWARDPRCVVPRGTLRQRLFVGEPCELAMTRPAMKGLRPIWDLERYRGGSYEALEIDANRFRLKEQEPDEFIERTRLP